MIIIFIEYKGNLKFTIKDIKVNQNKQRQEILVPVEIPISFKVYYQITYQDNIYTVQIDLQPLQP